MASAPALEETRAAKHAGADASVIAQWRGLLRMEPGLGSEALRALYWSERPAQGELILSGACEFACQHCLYPTDYGGENPSLSAEELSRILPRLNEDLGIRSFVYCGRTITRGGVSAMASLRRHVPGAALGIIDNGISLIPHLDALQDLQLDWVDLSFDGPPEIHDEQRRRPGSFADGLRGLRAVMSRGLAPRVSVLTCLTRLNAHSVARLFRLLYAEGVRNFFMTPVTVVPGVRPDPSLALDGESLREVARTCREVASALDDAYIEIGLFESEQLLSLATAPEKWVFKSQGEHLCYAEDCGSTTFALKYWPSSLNGLRDFIVNADGRVLMPKSIAWGRIPDDAVIGDLRIERPDVVWARLTESAAFGWFESELNMERQKLNDVLA